jgi:hypothetical protein
MRRRHWWGAAIGAGLLASAAFVAPAALAAPASLSSVTASKQGPQPQKKVVAKHRPATKPGRAHHNHDDNWYPPHATPSVHITVPSHARKGRTLNVSATVSINNKAVSGVKAGLYGSIDGGHNWKLYTEQPTGQDGSVTFPYTVRHDVILRVVVSSDKGRAAAMSESVAVHTGR